MADSDAPAIGHNNPPVEMDPKAYEKALREEHSELSVKIENFTSGVDRMPEKIDDQKTFDKALKLRAQLHELGKTVENTRKKAKTPWDEMGKAVQKVFKEGMLAHIDKAIKIADKRIAPWKKKLDDEERARRKAEQEKAAAEHAAAAAAAEAAARGEGNELAQQVAAEKAAESQKALEKANRQAAAPVGPAHGSQGGRISTVKNWVFKVLVDDMIDYNALREHITAEERDKILNRYVRAGGRQVPGVAIYQEEGVRG